MPAARETVQTRCSGCADVLMPRDGDMGASRGPWRRRTDMLVAKTITRMHDTPQSAQREPAVYFLQNFVSTSVYA